jgi:hypothetical protein
MAPEPHCENHQLVLNVPAHLRIAPSFADLSPFGAGEHGRPLRIVIDDETAVPGPALDMLRAFSARPSVEVFSTSSAAVSGGPSCSGGPRGVSERDVLVVLVVDVGGVAFGGVGCVGGVLDGVAASGGRGWWR